MLSLFHPLCSFIILTPESPMFGFSERDNIIKLFTNSALTKCLIPSTEILSWNKYKLFNLLKKPLAIWRFLCSYLGVPIENSVAFGDGSNDITMIRAAGTGVAMGNAIDEVKRAAKLVAAGNDEDGVALTLEKLFG
ncbi:MAG: HAD hydrolase family protein [Oscillospiraceae bacterium]|nr:HAD hydrolase family protein [Oscillospiraceae bacterium]